MCQTMSAVKPPNCRSVPVYDEAQRLNTDARLIMRSTDMPPMRIGAEEVGVFPSRLARMPGHVFWVNVPDSVARATNGAGASNKARRRAGLRLRCEDRHGSPFGRSGVPKRLLRGGWDRAASQGGPHGSAVSRTRKRYGDARGRGSAPA